jgi:cytochrome c biogenesis protein CcmG/thiol:disulfide interchange protein DsbE
MNWKRSVIGAALATPLVALLAYGLTQDPRIVESPLPGKTAPDFTLQVMDSAGSVSLAALRGDIVVVNFWASWCLNCRFEHRILSETATAYRDKGVRFYGILYKDTPENGRAFINEMGGQSYPSLLDPRVRTAIDFGLYGAPETFIIDHQGTVAHKVIGPVVESTLPEFRAVLDELVARRAGAR